MNLLVSAQLADIYDPSTSSALRLEREEADRRIEDYNQMIAAQQVADAGYSFITSVFKTHTSYQKALGTTFDALRETLGTQRKQVSAATAVVDLETEKLKFAQRVQLNQQAAIRLSGEEAKTGLIPNLQNLTSDIFLNRPLRRRFKKISGFGFSRIWYNPGAHYR